MSIERFTLEEIEQLEKNPNVKKVSDKSITYTESFKEHFIIEYKRGKLPSKIFEEAGFDVHVLGVRIKSASYRWQKQTKRLEGLKDTRKGASGRPKTRDLTDAEIIIRQKAQIELLKQERDFLLELKRLERVMIKKEGLSHKKSTKSSNK
jgi:transposase